MINLTIDTDQTHNQINFDPSADFISCAMTALFAAVPVFLETLMTCLAASPPPGAYNPGKRPRCT